MEYDLDIQTLVNQLNNKKGSSEVDVSKKDQTSLSSVQQSPEALATQSNVISSTRDYPSSSFAYPSIENANSNIPPLHLHSLRRVYIERIHVKSSAHVSFIVGKQGWSKCFVE